MAQKGKSETGEKTCIKGMGFSGHSVGSHISEVDVKDGKITRIRPLHYDSKYKPEEFSPWKIEARGKVFEPPMKSLITPFGGFLVEVEPINLDELRQKYPEAFSKPYGRASGLRFDRVIVKGA